MPGARRPPARESSRRPSVPEHELVKRFEDYEPSPTDERDPAVFGELRRAVLSRSDAERSIKRALKHARERGYSWAFIGSLVGTSGEAARQRYGHKQDT
jgi:hypothetical protein